MSTASKVESKVTDPLQQGRLVVAAISGAWRICPAPLTLSPATLNEITPLLVKTTTAGLVWRRLCRSDQPVPDAALPLREAYRYEVLQAGVREQQIIQTLEALRDAQVDPLLAKGWAVARLYPERGLRPYGDIDVYVRPEQYPVAAAALAGHGTRTGAVDLHRGVKTLDDRSWYEIYDRSQAIPLAHANVRVLGAEDQLRHLCLHLWRHGASRPLWLCDIGAALEALPPNFDWEYFYRGNRRRAEWVSCALELVHQLLGARASEIPISRRVEQLPGWLEPAVFRQWQVGRGHIGTLPAAAFLRRPAGVLKALRLRWPNPIQATVTLNGPFNKLPRLPFQLGECFLRSAHFVTNPWRAAGISS